MATAATPLTSSAGTKRKVIVRDGVALNVVERKVAAEDVGGEYAEAAIGRARSSHGSMSDAGKEITSPSSVGKDENAARVYDLSGPGATAGSEDVVAAFDEAYDAYFYEITGDEAPQPTSQSQVQGTHPLINNHFPYRRPALTIIQEKRAQDGSISHEALFSTSDFMLTSVSLEDVEKMQIVQTFGIPTIYFHGRRPIGASLRLAFFNSINVNWLNHWWQDYEREIRGTRTAENGARVYFEYNGKILEGYVYSCRDSHSGDSDLGAVATISMVVTGINYINSLTSTGERPEVPGLYTTANPRDRVLSVDPMKVDSYEELHQLGGGTNVPEGNGQVQLQSERFIQTTAAPVPMVGFVAVEKAAVPRGLLSVEFSDPLANESGIDSALRQLVAEEPEGLITVPNKSAQGDKQLWQPSRSVGIKRIVLMDPRGNEPDSSALSRYRSGARPAPHYFVCRGDSAHPVTGTRLKPGQVIQLVQEKYTSFLIGDAGRSSSLNVASTCTNSRSGFAERGRSVLDAYALNRFALDKEYRTIIDVPHGSAIGLPGVSADDLIEAGIGRWPGGTEAERFLAIYTVGKLLSQDVLQSICKGVLARSPIKIGSENLTISTLRNLVVALLHVESQFYADGVEAVGPVVSDNAQSAAGIAQFLPGTARDRGMKVQANSRRGGAFKANSRIRGTFKAGPAGNVFDPSLGGKDPYTKFSELPELNGKWQDDRFDPLISVCHATSYLIWNIKFAINDSSVPSPESLEDAILFGLQSYNSGVGTIQKARRKAASDGSGGGSTFCSILSGDEDDRYVRIGDRAYARKIVDRIMQNTTAPASDGSEEPPPRLEQGEPSPDSSSVFVCINGPAGSTPYTDEQLAAATRLINDIARRNSSVAAGGGLVGRKHVGGVETKQGGPSLRYEDPESAEQGGFDFGAGGGGVSLNSALKNAELNRDATMVGDGGQWWEPTGAQAAPAPPPRAPHEPYPMP